MGDQVHSSLLCPLGRLSFSGLSRSPPLYGGNIGTIPFWLASLIMRDSSPWVSIDSTRLQGEALTAFVPDHLLGDVCTVNGLGRQR